MGQALLNALGVLLRRARQLREDRGDMFEDDAARRAEEEEDELDFEDEDL
jgi:hypothetical protein